MMKMVNGTAVEVTGPELAARQAEEQAWAAAQAARDAEAARLQAIRDDALRQQLVSQLATATNAQISAFVDAQVIDLASARTMLKRILLLLAAK